MSTFSADVVRVYIGNYGDISTSNADPRWNGYRIPMDVWKRARRLFPKYEQIEERMLYVDRWMYEFTHELNKGLLSREPEPIVNPKQNNHEDTRTILRVSPH